MRYLGSVVVARQGESRAGEVRGSDEGEGPGAGANYFDLFGSFLASSSSSCSTTWCMTALR